jgi:hypothetical protein
VRDIDRDRLAAASVVKKVSPLRCRQPVYRIITVSSASGRAPVAPPA